GGKGADTFVFSRGYGLDRVIDFLNDIDTLRIDNALWAGVTAVRTVQQVITTYATNLAGGAVRFDFGADELTICGVADRQLLIDDITIF
ncbi:MAG: hypothetical protein ACRC14_09580, partial [Paracoccaceae bacterium]